MSGNSEQTPGPPDPCGWLWLIMGLLVVGGSITATVLINLNNVPDPVLVCNPAIQPLNVTGTYNGTVLCNGVRDSGPFSETLPNVIFYVTQNPDMSFQMARGGAPSEVFQGSIPLGSSTMGFGLLTGLPPLSTIESGTWLVKQLCSAGDNTTVVNTVLRGRSTINGVDTSFMPAETFTKTCDTQLTRVDESVPTGAIAPSPP